MVPISAIARCNLQAYLSESYSWTRISPQQSFSAMFSPNSISRGAVKLCRSRRSKSKNISIKQRGRTMLPLTVASLYLGPTWGRLEGRLRAVNRSLRSGRCAPTLTTAPLFHDERPGEGCGLLRATLGAHDAGQGNPPVPFPPGHLTGPR